MNRYHDFIRYLAVCLIVAYASTGGHVLCAICHFSHSLEHAEHHCGHSQCQPSEVPPPTHCESEPCEGHPCDIDELPDVILPRSNDEPISPPSVSSSIVGSDVSVKYQPSLIDFRTITSHTDALSLRLHLLYRVLVI